MKTKAIVGGVSFFASMMLAAGSVFAAAPSVTVNSVSQRADREIVVSFTLANAPAIVTLTMLEGDEPIAASSVTTLAGAFGKKLTADGDYEIRWRADIDLPDRTFAAGSLKAKLKAWPIHDPPDYLVVSLARGVKERVRYYETAESLPGGLLKNDEYKLTKLVMRRIHANGVKAVMGGISYETGYYAYNEGYGPCEFALDHDYYIGVFEITLGQWYEMAWNDSGRIYTETIYTQDAARRPASKLYYSYLRGPNAGELPVADDKPGEAPPSGSVLDLLRSHTGVDFDLPTNAEWQFAGRSGVGYDSWNNGASMTNSTRDLQMPGRFLYNGGGYYDEDLAKWVAAPYNCDTNQGIAVVGSYEPNAWGLYDMHGNVGEWVRDFWADDTRLLRGQLNETVSESADGHGYHPVLGGYFSHAARDCKISWREREKTNNSYAGLGARLVCPVTLTEEE